MYEHPPESLDDGSSLDPDLDLWERLNRSRDEGNRDYDELLRSGDLTGLCALDSAYLV